MRHNKTFSRFCILVFCVLSFISCDGSVKGGYPESLTIGNDWNHMKAVGAMSQSGLSRTRDISRGGALEDGTSFIAVNDDGSIENIILFDENGNNVLEGKIVSYYKQRSRFDFVNIQSPDNPNDWPFDDWVHTPDDSDALLFVVDKGSGRFYLLNGTTSQKWFTDGWGTFGVGTCEYGNMFLSSIHSWDNNSVPIGFHKFTFGEDGLLNLDTYWTRDVTGNVWLDRFGTIFYEHYTEDPNGGANLHGVSYSLTGIKTLAENGSQNSFKFADGYTVKVGFNGLSYLFRDGESPKYFAEDGQLVNADYVPKAFKDLNSDTHSIRKGLSDFYIRNEEGGYSDTLKRIVFQDEQRIEYECNVLDFPKGVIYGVTEDYFYYFHNGKVIIKNFSNNEELVCQVTTDEGIPVVITMFTEGSRGNMNFQGKAGSDPVSGYIMPDGSVYFTENALDFDSVIISPIN